MHVEWDLSTLHILDIGKILYIPLDKQCKFYTSQNSKLYLFSYKLKYFNLKFIIASVLKEYIVVLIKT